MRSYGSFHTVRHRRRPAVGRMFGTGAIALVLVALFFSAVKWFRAKHDQPVAQTSPTDISNVLTPSPVDASILNAASAASNEATLAGSGGTGTALRGTADGQFTMKIKATLPDIDRTTTDYEAWLVRPVPYDYFSLGTFVTNDTGDWVLEWSGAAGKYDGYTQVVVTREAKDGNPDPSDHVLEGEFE